MSDLAWWYISYGSHDGLPAEQGFRGAAFIHASDPFAAVKRADFLDITPTDDESYEAAVIGPLNDDEIAANVPVLNLERLLTLPELGPYAKLRIDADGTRKVIE